MNKPGRKMSLTQGIETRVSLSEENILLKIVNDVLFYSLQSSPASVFTHWSVNNFISHR